MGAIYRMVSVVLGCLIGLVINYTFRKITLPMLPRIETETNPDNGGEWAASCPAPFRKCSWIESAQPAASVMRRSQMVGTPRGGVRSAQRADPTSPFPRRHRGAVKKLKTAKIRLRKSLDANGVILGFGAFRQSIHSSRRIAR